MAAELANAQTDWPAVKAAGAVFELTVSAGFEAAHYMPGKAADHPYRAVHGHSFRLEATVRGTLQPGNEWVQDAGELKRALESVAAKLDHRMLNDIAGLEVPTLERICVWAAGELKPVLPGLARIALLRPSLHERCELILSAHEG
jgi:6-pyruvoyltetrahydropterin/6-carboxytetrahydropterin synthase